MISGVLIDTVVIPVSVCLVGAVLVRLAAPQELARQTAALIGLGAGYLAGHVAIAALPAWPPLDTTQGVFYLVVVVLALGVLEGAVRLGHAGRWALRLALIATLLVLTLHPMLRHRWGPVSAVTWLASLAAAMLVLGAAYRWLGARLGPGAAGVSWATAFAGAGVLLVLARTALLAQLSVVVAILVAALLLAARGRLDAPLHPAALPLLSALFWALLLNGAFYAQLSAGAAMAAAASPLGAALAQAPWGRGRGWRGALLAGAGVLLVLAPFVVRAVAENPEETRLSQRRGRDATMHSPSFGTELVQPPHLAGRGEPC